MIVIKRIRIRNSDYSLISGIKTKVFKTCKFCLTLWLLAFQKCPPLTTSYLCKKSTSYYRLPVEDAHL